MMDELKKFDEMPAEEKINILKVYELFSAGLEADELQSHLSEAAKKFAKPLAKQKTLDSWLQKSKSTTPEKPGRSNETPSDNKTTSPASISTPEKIDKNKSEKNVPQFSDISKSVLNSNKLASESPSISCDTSNDEICVLNVQNCEASTKLRFVNPIIRIKRLDFKNLTNYCDITREIKQEYIDDFQENQSVAQRKPSNEKDLVEATSIASCDRKESNNLTNYDAENITVSNSLVFSHKNIGADSTLRKANTVNRSGAKRKRTPSKDYDNSSKRKTRHNAKKKIDNLPCDELTNELDADCEGKIMISPELNNCENNVSKKKLLCKSKKRNDKKKNLNIVQDKTVEKLSSKHKVNPSNKRIKELEKKELNSTNSKVSLTKQILVNINETSRNEVEISNNPDKFSSKDVHCNTLLNISKDTMKTVAPKKNLSEILPKVLSSKNFSYKKKGKKTELVHNVVLEAGNSTKSSSKTVKHFSVVSFEQNSANLSECSKSNSKQKSEKSVTFSFVSDEPLPKSVSRGNSCLTKKKSAGKLNSLKIKQNVIDSDESSYSKNKKTKDSAELDYTENDTNILVSEDNAYKNTFLIEKIKTNKSESTAKLAFSKPSKKSHANKNESTSALDSFEAEQSQMGRETCPPEIKDQTELNNNENLITFLNSEINVNKSDTLAVPKLTIQSCNVIKNNCTTSPDSQSNYNAYCKISKLCADHGLNLDDIFNNDKFKIMIDNFRKNPADAIVFIGTAKSLTENKIEPTVMVHKSRKQLLEILSANQLKNSSRTSMKY